MPEVFLDAIGGRGWRRAQEPRLELLAMGSVVDPFAGGGDPLACRNSRRVTNHGDDVAMPADLRAEHAKAVLGVVVGDAFDKACQHFLGQRLGLRIHGAGHVIDFVSFSARAGFDHKPFVGQPSGQPCNQLRRRRLDSFGGRSLKPRAGSWSLK
jgi:hypothetical protein